MTERVDLDKHSMFATTPIYRVNDTLVFGLRRDSILPDDSDVMVKVLQAWESRLDLLSVEMYGTPHLWWAIAELNHVIDPFTEITAGKELRIARRERLLNLIES